VAGLVDQVVVVDTGSTDGTQGLAKGYGAEVERFRWRGDFSAARNRSLELMRTDHVMWLDADNSIDPSGLWALRERLSGGPQIIVATEIVVPQGDRLWQKRVFFRSPKVRFEGTVHEQLAHPADWPVEISNVEIRHWGYADAASARRKGQRNLELLISAAETAEGDFYHLYQIGRTLYNLRYLREAEERLEMAAWAPDGDPSEGFTENPSLWSHALLLLAQCRERLGRHEEARAALVYLVRHRPDYGPGRAALGRRLYDQGRLEEAARSLELALAAGCGDPGWGADPAKEGFKTACLLAKTFERAGKPDKAFGAWRVASSFDPRHPEPLVAMAESALASGDRPGAGKLLALAMSLAPAHRRALSLAGALEAGL
jgi:tetratricopeptide (TPR) repeat protein